jgi:hypothetical protein
MSSITTVESPLDSEPPLAREPGTYRPLRFMGRRRVNRTDRNGDPLDGVVNLFDVAIVLAVAFLLAALTAIGLSGVLSNEDFTVVTNPGKADMQVIVKKGSKVSKLDLTTGQQVTGLGTLIGQFYRLPDGTTVYVPQGSTGSTGAATGTAPAVAVTPTPPGVTTTPAATSTPAAGTPSATLPPPDTPPGTVPTQAPVVP